MSNRSPGKQQFRYLVALLRREQVGTGLLQVPQQRAGVAACSATISTDSLVHRTRIVEALAVHDPQGRLGQVGGRVHQHRHVAGADADGGRARTVGGAHHRHAPGRAMTLVRSSS